jgi:hypothetical protein
MSLHVRPRRSPNATLASLLALAPLVASACAPGGRESTLAVSWSIEALGSGPLTCAGAGATSVEVVTRALAATAAATAEFPCAAGAALVRIAAPDEVAVTIRLRDEAGRALAELVFPRTAHAAGGTLIELGSVIFQVLTLPLSWTLRSASGAVTCAEAHALAVAVDATPAPSPFTWMFPCDPPQARSVAIGPGRYDLRFRLLASDAIELAITSLPGVELRADRPPMPAQVTFTLP